MTGKYLQGEFTTNTAVGQNIYIYLPVPVLAFLGTVL